MKLYAYISPVLYKQFCKLNWLEDNDESLRQFLREFGTYSLSFQDGSGDHQAVPPGTCVRLHSSDKYGALSTRFLNLYTTMYSKQEEVHIQPSKKSSWWCWWT